MTSFEQAEAEADERYFEERDDMDAATTAAEANRVRRRAMWNAYCTQGCPSPSKCPCIEACASCGHLAAEHEITEGHRTGVIVAGECQREDCDCSTFLSVEDYDGPGDGEAWAGGFADNH